MFILDRAIDIILNNEQINTLSKDDFIELLQNETNNNTYQIDEKSVRASHEIMNYYLKQIISLSGYEWDKAKNVYSWIGNADNNNNISHQTVTNNSALQAISKLSPILPKSATYKVEKGNNKYIK